MRRPFLTVGVIILTAGLLAGCPKRPEVGQAGPGAVGPSAATAPATQPAPGGARTGEVPVARPSPPAEAQIQAAPSPPATGEAAQAPGAGRPGEARPGAPPGMAAPGSVPPRTTPPAATPPGAPAAPGRPSAAATAATPLQDIFFDFDRSAVRDDQRPALDANVVWLKGNPSVWITVEGHADERGTNEYNLALGERRAKATKDYLVVAGIDPNRVAIVSYGEERPFVLGHDESAWKWNRRSHFVVPSR